MIALARCNKTATRVLLHALRAGSRRVLLSDPGLFRPWGQVSSEAKDMLHRCVCSVSLLIAFSACQGVKATILVVVLNATLQYID